MQSVPVINNGERSNSAHGGVYLIQHLTNKADRHDILLKVVLNNLNPNPNIYICVFVYVQNGSNECCLDIRIASLNPAHGEVYLVQH